MSRDSYVFPPQHRAVVDINESELKFPVHRIYCVGQNYADHAREMGSDPVREPPFFFSKPADAIIRAGRDSGSPIAVKYPGRTSNLHHEIELVVAIGTGGSNISVDDAGRHVYGLAVGLDLTRRDLQKQAKDRGRPWDTSKGFDQSAPISAVHPVAEGKLLEQGGIWLNVNGELRQQGNISDMIWNIREVIAELSTLFHLESGDLIFTGTPAGVAAVVQGDVLEGGVDGLGSLSIRLE